MAGLRRSTKRIILWLILFVLILGAFAVYHVYSMRRVKATYEKELAVVNETIVVNTREVYVAARDIKYKEVITEADIMKVSALISLEEAVFFTPEDIGSIATVNIPVGTILTSNMVVSEVVDKTLRETEFDVFVLNSNVTNNDVVDVRIRYLNGEDYVVLSKKVIKHLSLKNAVCYMDLTEEEMQLVSSAIVDASVRKAVLYTTTYIEPSVQEGSVVTYQPSVDVLELIYSNPNIVSVATENLSAVVRLEMEKRLAAYNNAAGKSSGPVFNITDVPNVEDVGNMMDGYVDTNDVTGGHETQE